VIETKASANKLERIRKIWEELARTRPGTPEYHAIMENIRTLSAEYRVLVGASKKLGKSERVIAHELDQHPD
jgi:hypothetical protein